MQKPKKPRNAYVLYMRGTPFKPKTIKSKKTYTRKRKHKHEKE